MTLEIESPRYGKHFATQWGHKYAFWAPKNKKETWLGSLHLDGFDARLRAYM